MTSYLDLLPKNEATDIKNLTKRPQGLTVESWECIEGEIMNEEKETFFDVEEAAEFVASRNQNVFGAVTFNY
jgi:hypothetical protein